MEGPRLTVSPEKEVGAEDKSGEATRWTRFGLFFLCRFSASFAALPECRFGFCKSALGLNG